MDGWLMDKWLINRMLDKWEDRWDDWWINGVIDK